MLGQPRADTVTGSTMPTKAMRLVLAAATIAAVGLAAPVPARAAGTTSTAWKSSAVTCVRSFGFTSTAASGSTATGATVTLKGYIQPCTTTPAGAKDYFGIGRYELQERGGLGAIRVVSGQAAVWYATPTGVTSFSIPVQIGATSPALCMAPGPSVRLTCVDVSWSGGAPVVKPLSTKDPKVTATLPDPWALSGPEPKCGACWGS